jgi:SH3 domain protein
MFGMMRMLKSWGDWRPVAAVVIVAVLQFGAPALAQTLYVTDEVKLTVRSGPGLDRKILSIIESGERVEMREEGEEWSLVELTDGRQGWVLTRYLTQQVPDRVALQELRSRYTALMSQSEGLTTESGQLKSENQGLKERVQTLEGQLQQLKADYDGLRRTADASKAEIRKYMMFFVSGAGILLVGILLGFLTRRPRRKSMLV